MDTDVNQNQEHNEQPNRFGISGVGMDGRVVWARHSRSRQQQQQQQRSQSVMGAAPFPQTISGRTNALVTRWGRLDQEQRKQQEQEQHKQQKSPSSRSQTGRLGSRGKSVQGVKI